MSIAAPHAASLRAPQSGAARTPAQPARLERSIWLIDQFCFTPWYTAALAASLQPRVAQLRLVASSFTREPAYFRSHGLAPQPGPFNLASRIPPAGGKLRRLLRVAETLINSRVLCRELERRPPDLIHFQQTPLLSRKLRADFRLVSVAQRARIPVVHTVHNLLPHDSHGSLHAIYAEFYQRMDRLICHSASAARDLEQQFAVPDARIRVIPHGPLFAPRHPPDRDRSRMRLGLPPDRPIVLFQGIFAPYKGLDVLLQAWALCRQCWASRDPQSSPLLLIAGSGPCALEAAVRQAAAHAPASIRADIGYIPVARLADYFAAADLLVYPYRAITTSGALLTGLSYARPILASHLPAFAEYLIDGGNAILVPPSSAAHLAQALLTLLGADGALLHQLAQRAAHNPDLCPSWSELADRTIALYRDLLSPHH